MADTPYKPPDYIGERPVLPSLDWMLDWYLKEHRTYWDRWEQAEGERTWRASSLGYCLRQQTLHRLGVPSPRHYDAKTIRTFAWGDEVHRFVRKVYSRMGLVVAEEPVLTDAARNITGHADLIWNPSGNPADLVTGHPTWSPEWVEWLTVARIRWHQQLADMYGGEDAIPDEWVGLELKSAHSNSMRYIFKDGPGPEHRAQAGIYKHMAQTTPVDANPDIAPLLPLDSVKRWFIGYVGKDSVGLLSYEVEDAWVDEALTRLDALNDAWGRILPKCDCPTRYGGKGPLYCDYSEGDSCCGRDTRGQVAKYLRTMKG